MNDKDKAFQDWWDKVAYPGLVNSPGSIIIMRHIDDIKKATKECWDASWAAATHAVSILHK